MRAALVTSPIPALILSGLLLTCANAAQAADRPTTRFKLQTSSVEQSAQGEGRFSVRGRFAPEAKAGELRESDRFTVIGRIASPAVNCGDDGIFSNGFEG